MSMTEFPLATNNFLNFIRAHVRTRVQWSYGRLDQQSWTDVMNNETSIVFPDTDVEARYQDIDGDAVPMVRRATLQNLEVW